MSGKPSENPPNPAALYNQANSLVQAARPAEAAELYRRAIQLKPDFLEATNNLGYVLRQTGDLEGAAAAFRRMIELAPQFFGGFCNLGVVLTELGQLDEAMATLQPAIELAPTEAEPHYAMGNALYEQTLFQSAAACFREAILLNPDQASAHYNHARTLLLLGDYPRGWPEYEWRAIAQPRYWFPPQTLPKPQWDGRELNGQTVFLHAEQGFGDTLQFIRFAPMVNQRGGRVVLCCPAELVQLLRSVKGIDHVAAINAPPNNYDFHCPLMSLPLALKTELSTIPTEPYLSAEPEHVEKWKTQIRPSSRLKVGLVWAGSPGFKLTHLKSISASQFSPLAQLPNVDFFSLQKGQAAADASSTSLPLIDWTNRLNTFADTAALIANLDLVIAVDTAVAHLAAAMGKPTWVLIPKTPDWRWLLNRTDSPWYPSVRLFRQQSAGDWASVIDSVQQALQTHQIH